MWGVTPLFILVTRLILSGLAWTDPLKEGRISWISCVFSIVVGWRCNKKKMYVLDTHAPLIGAVEYLSVNRND